MLASWQNTIVDDAGNIQGEASIEVRRESNGALAALFSDRAGSNPVSNPVTAGEDGFVRFYASGGALKITATKGGFSREWRHVPVGLLSELDNVPESLVRYDRTGAEIDASVTPTNYGYKSSPERYGALGDGTTDDTTALQAWASVADTRELLDRTYKCNDRLTFPKHASIIGKGSGRSIIDFSGADGTFFGEQAMSFTEGEFVALPATTGDPAEGDTQIEFAEAHNLSEGDIFFLHDDTSGSWSGFNNNYTKGEACVVGEIISSTVVGLLEPLYDSYTSASTDAFQLDYGTVQMEGVGIKGIDADSTVIPLFISHVAHARLRDVKVTGTGDTTVSIRHSYDVEINGGTVYQFNGDDPGSTSQYGLTLAHCQDVRVNGSSLQGARHAVTTGAVSGGGIVNRGILVSGCTLRSTIDCAADFHGNTEHSAYDGCVIHGGVALGGDNNACRNSTVIGHEDIHQGQPIRFREMKGFNFDLSNLQCSTLADPHSVGGTGVIDIAGSGSSTSTLTANTTRGGTLTINNVRVDAPNANAGARFANRGCTQDLDIRVQGLQLNINAGADTAFGLFRLDNVSGGNFRSITLYNVTGTPGLVRSKINFDVDDIIWEHEVGSFTPAIAFGGGVTGITYSHQVGRYELVGNVVHWHASILLSNKGSSTGNATIENLPFTILNVTNLETPAPIQGFNMTFADVLDAIHVPNSRQIILQEVTNAGVLSTITNADFTNTTRIRAYGSYRRAI